MNQDNKKQIIVAAVLGVVLLGILINELVIKGVTAPPPTAGSTSSSAATASATSTAKSTSQPVVPLASFQEVDIDLDGLNEKVKEVTFRYEIERISRSPMTPLKEGGWGGDDDTTPIEKEIYDTIADKTVTGIIYNDYKPIAIVDDEVVSEGHQYPGGYVLVKIEPKRVWFSWGDTEIPLDLKEL